MIFLQNGKSQFQFLYHDWYIVVDEEAEAEWSWMREAEWTPFWFFLRRRRNISHSGPKRKWRNEQKWIKGENGMNVVNDIEW